VFHQYANVSLIDRAISKMRNLALMSFSHQSSVLILRNKFLGKGSGNWRKRGNGHL